MVVKVASRIYQTVDDNEVKVWRNILFCSGCFYLLVVIATVAIMFCGAGLVEDRWFACQWILRVGEFSASFVFLVGIEKEKKFQRKYSRLVQTEEFEHTMNIL